MIHSTLSGLELHEPYHYVQEGDPGAVTTGKYWLKISTGVVKRRNAANDGWDTLGGGGITTFLGLSDTPDAFTAQGGKLVAVKGDVSGLEFISPTPAIVTNATTAFSLDATHIGKWVRCTAATAVTITVPNAVFAANDEVTIEQAGVGQITLVESSVTINKVATLQSRVRYSVIALKFSAANVAVLTGDTA